MPSRTRRPGGAAHRRRRAGRPADRRPRPTSGDDDDEPTEGLGRRPRRAAGEGDAHRHDDQAAARGGAHSAARRGVARPAARHPPPLDHRARGGPRPRAGRGARAALAPVHRRPRARPSPSCASRRPSWSAGSRGCSTASRPRCSPSRWPRRPSSSRCVAARSAPADAGRSRRPGVPGVPAPATSAAAASTSDARSLALINAVASRAGKRRIDQVSARGWAAYWRVRRGGARRLGRDRPQAPP